jgi:hypothetical protein
LSIKYKLIFVIDCINEQNRLQVEFCSRFLELSQKLQIVKFENISRHVPDIKNVGSGVLIWIISLKTLPWILITETVITGIDCGAGTTMLKVLLISRRKHSTRFGNTRGPILTQRSSRLQLQVSFILMFPVEFFTAE